MDKNVEKWIVSNPEIRSGKPCLRNTRLTVEDIIRIVKDNEIDNYDYINEEMILACIVYQDNRDRKN